MTDPSPEVAQATRIAAALRSAGFSLPEVALGLVDPRCFPDLDVVELREVLRATAPDVTDEDARAAIEATGKYSSDEIEAAFAPPVVQPAVGTSYGNDFDDWPAVRGWGPITALDIVHGDIFNGFTAHYGDQSSTYGGAIGATQSIALEPGDRLVELSGFYGQWFGATTIVQVTFRTRQGASFGPFGTMAFASGQVAFTFTAPSGREILAFHGAARDGVLAGGQQTQFMSRLGITVGIASSTTS